MGNITLERNIMKFVYI